MEFITYAKVKRDKHSIRDPGDRQTDKYTNEPLDETKSNTTCI